MKLSEFIKIYGDLDCVKLENMPILNLEKPGRAHFYISEAFFRVGMLPRDKEKRYILLVIEQKKDLL